MAGYAKYAFDVQKGMHDGVRGVLFDTAGGLFGFASDPLGTSYSMLNSMFHPIDTYNIVKDAIHTSYERDVINGEAESRAEWFSYAGGTIITSALGTKGAGTVTKAGTATAKTGIATAKTKIGNLEFSNPFGRDPELALAGGNIPYNVYDGNAVENQHLQFAENFKDGKSGVNAESGLLFSGRTDKYINNANSVTYKQSSIDKAFTKHRKDFGRYPDGSKASVELFKKDISELIDTGVQK